VDPLDKIVPAKVPLKTPVNIATVGRLVPWKRVDTLIEAIVKLDHVGLVVIGEGPERGHLESLASTLGITDRIVFAGQRSEKETLELMAACDLFALNSTYEGFPHVVLQAMNLGLPIIATAVGGTPEVLSDKKNGRLIPPTDAGTLSKALLQLVSSSSMRQRLGNAAQKAIESFNLKRMLEETEAVLLNAANSRDHR
jgi:glycosyltransferase involved in cell wall biosynthesis